MWLPRLGSGQVGAGKNTKTFLKTFLFVFVFSVFLCSSAITFKIVKVIITENYEELSKKAAGIFISQLKEKPNSVLGFATGSTPVGMYQELIKAYNQGEVDFSQATSFNLDEYYPITPTNGQSYHYFMWNQLFDHIDIKPDRIHLPDGQAKEVEKFCADYEKAIIDAGGIDLQVLGIGRNGHIAFNEPGSSFDSRTRVVDLDQDTIEANSRFFKNISEVPRQAITMGLATIMECKKIVILANGKSKAEAVAKAVEGEATEEVPASTLQRHGDVMFVLEKEAASKLKSIG